MEVKVLKYVKIGKTCYSFIFKTRFGNNSWQNDFVR